MFLIIMWCYILTNKDVCAAVLPQLPVGVDPACAPELQNIKEQMQEVAAQPAGPDTDILKQNLLNEFWRATGRAKVCHMPCCAQTDFLLVLCQ